MPYRCDGNKLMHKKDGKWTLKQTTKSHANCVKAMGLLYAVEKNPNYKAENPIKK